MRMRPRLENVLAPLGEYLTNSTEYKSKPPIAMENPIHFRDFETSFLPNHYVSTLSVPAQGQDMIVYQLDIPRTSTATPTAKKAIVHIVGTTGYVAKNLPELEPFIRTICTETAALDKNVKISFFCQDYRARGFNKKIDEESFNQFSIDRDAKDQSELIKKLIKEGYKPEDILIHTHSYGSGVALWMLYKLIQQEGMDFANIKLFCDRGYGNFLDFPLLDILQSDNLKSNNPLKSKDEIVKKDESYRANDQSTTYPSLRFQILGIKSHQLIEALLLEKPIAMRFPFDFSSFKDCVKGYSMGKEDYIALAPHVYAKKTPVTYDPTELFVKSPILGSLLKSLHQYCLERAKRAADSGQGGAYKHNTRITRKWGWTAEEQITCATNLMAELSKPDPNWDELIAYADQKGPHHSGHLVDIYIDVANFAIEMQHLQEFNKQILSLKASRDKRAQAKLENFSRNRVFNAGDLKIDEDYRPSRPKQGAA